MEIRSKKSPMKKILQNLCKGAALFGIIAYASCETERRKELSDKTVIERSFPLTKIPPINGFMGGYRLRGLDNDEDGLVDQIILSGTGLFLGPKHPIPFPVSTSYTLKDMKFQELREELYQK